MGDGGLLSKDATETYLEPPQKARDQLVDLEQADVLADAGPAAGAELEHHAVHLLDALLLVGAVAGGVDEPALGAVGVGVGAPELGAAVDDPGGAADDGAPRDVVAGNLDAGGRDDALERQAGGRGAAGRPP